MDSMPSIPISIAAVAAIVIGFWDFRRLRIPNVITFPLLGTGWMYHAWWDGGSGLAASVLGTLVGVGILFLPYLLGGIGAGDVKLLAAMGAWLQVRLVVLAFGCGGLLLGLVCLYRLSRQRSLQQSTALSLRIAKLQLLSLGRSLVADERVEEVALRENGRNRLLPFGVFFAVGLILVIGWHLMQK
jgi:prepilin peptidase CpaA